MTLMQVVADERLSLIGPVVVIGLSHTKRNAKSLLHKLLYHIGFELFRFVTH